MTVDSVRVNVASADLDDADTAEPSTSFTVNVDDAYYTYTQHAHISHSRLHSTWNEWVYLYVEVSSIIRSGECSAERVIN